jgi:hypothetical protein
MHKFSVFIMLELNDLIYLFIFFPDVLIEVLDYVVFSCKCRWWTSS